MPYVVTNPTWFTAYVDGTFEGGTGVSSGGPGVSINPASTAQAQAGTRSLLVNCASVLGGAPVSGNGFDRQQNLVKIKSGNPIVAGRRYTVTIWTKVTNAGASGSSNTVKFVGSLGLDGFPAAGTVFSDFRAVFSSGIWSLSTFSINAPASIGATDATFAITAKWNQGQISPPIGGSGGPLTGAVIYFDTINIVEEEFVAAPSLTVTATSTNASNGGADGTIDVSVSGGTAPYTYSWNDGATTQDRSGLAAGTYTVTVTDSIGGTGVKSVQILELAAMTASYTKTDPTTTGGTDGSITVSVAGGSGSRGFSWSDGPTTQNRSGLDADTYAVTITDLTTGEIVVLTIILSDPGPPASVGTFLKVPKMQSFHMVVQETIDNCDNPQGLDNVLFCQQNHPYFAKGQYDQKVCKCDANVLQWNSDYVNFEVGLYNYLTNVFVKSFSWLMKEENVGTLQDFPVVLRNHTTPGQTRVYFSVGAIPIPVNVGDNFEIFGNADGFDGFYQIVNIVDDETLGYQYLLINVNYTAGPTSPATGRFSVSTADFNVYEAIISAIEVPDGLYYLKISALNTANINKYAYSEPIDLRVEHPDTNCIDFRNFDNAFDITWTTGMTGRIRVESVFFKRLPGGERTTSRNSDFSLVKVAARKARVLLFESFMLPPYLHEKLSVVFDMDYFAVNKIECQAAEGYGEPQYITRYPLANSSIKLEVVGWFDRYNSDDIGSIGEGGFIATETGFLKR